MGLEQEEGRDIVSRDAKNPRMCNPDVAHIYLHSLALHLCWCHNSLDSTGHGITD